MRTRCSSSPIASLAESGSDLLRIGGYEQLARAFDAIEERATFAIAAPA
jgi:hypothetical protein